MGGDPQEASPLAAARHWHEQGAQRIQVVDLDAAAGRTPNTGPISQLIQSMRHSARIDLYSGVSDSAGLDAALHIHPTQIVLSTASVGDLAFVESAVKQHGDQIGLRLVIAEGGALHAPGSAADGVDIWQLLPQLDAIGVKNYQPSDWGHAKHWWQPHHDILSDFTQATRHSVTAGSGVDALEDLHSLADLVPHGLDGAVIGRALTSGAFTYAEAMTAVEARYDPYMWGPAQP